MPHDRDADGIGGEERDDETGLVNLRTRYYDPGSGGSCLATTCRAR